MRLARACDSCAVLTDDDDDDDDDEGRDEDEEEAGSFEMRVAQ